MIDDVVYEVPAEFRERFKSFLSQPGFDRSKLEKQLQTYLETVRLIAPMVKAFNLQQMEQLGEVGLELLKAAADDPERQRLAQAAVRYLIEEEEDDEITGVLGLDDDVLVMNAVARAFGRADLMVEYR